MGRGESFIQVLIVINLIAFAFETLPDLSAGWLAFFKYLEVGTVLIFTVEYVLRIYGARPRKRYIFSFFGVVDLLAILPFYLAAGFDLRSIRALRLLRLFRILKLVRYSSAVERYHRAFLMIREELVLFGAGAVIAIYLSSVGIYYFENEAQPEAYASVFHACWWAIVTLTTVGFGDVYPITLGGRMFTVSVLVVGLGIVAVPTGLFASALTKVRDMSGSQSG